MERKMKNSGIEWIGEIPEEWGFNIIGNLYNPRNTKVSDKVYPPLSVTKNGIVPQLETAAKTDDGDNRKLVLIGDFVINSRSDRRGSCGISALDGSVSLINTIIAPRINMCHTYYNWLFHTEQFADEFYKWGHGIVDDLWTTRWQEMRNIAIVVPPYSEQQRIATFLDKKCSEIDSLIDLETQMIEELKTYKQSIITEAVTRGLHSEIPMKDSGIERIGEIPEHWEIVRLKTLGNTQNGISQSGDYFGDEFKYPFVSYSDVYNNIEVPFPQGRANSTKEDRKKFSLQEGDILFTRTSETIEEIGFCATCIKSIPDAVYSGFLIRFRPTSDRLTKEFSKYYFKSNIHRRYFVKEMNLVTRASLSQDLLKGMTVLLPPLPEQQAIAAYLDGKCADIDALIQLRQEKIETLKDYKKSVIFEYVTGKKQAI
jgi:type I restriction enzyme S subunit